MEVNQALILNECKTEKELGLTLRQLQTTYVIAFVSYILQSKKSR